MSFRYSDGCYGPGKRLNMGKVFRQPESDDLRGEYVVKVGNRELFRSASETEAREWVDWHNIRKASPSKAEIFWEAAKKEDAPNEPPKWFPRGPK